MSLRIEQPSTRNDSIKIAIHDLECELTREEIMRSHIDELGRISDEDRRKIFGKARQLAPEIAIPLRSSSEALDIGLAANDDTNIGWLNRERALEISDVKENDALDHLAGRIIQFNTQNGYGKFAIETESLRNEYGKEVSFRVAKEKLAALSETVLDAMKEPIVIGEFSVTRDQENNPKRLELLDLRDI